MNPNNYTMRCGNGSHCRHRFCETCGRPLRDTRHASQDHPGTVSRYTTASCKTCYNDAMRLRPSDLQDQRHILLSDEEMAHIWEVDPLHHDWHMRRRYRLRLGEAA